MKKFSNILYVHQPESDRASIARAVSLAKNNLAELTVISVIPPVPRFRIDETSEDELSNELLEQRRQQLTEFLAPFGEDIDYDILFGKRHIEVIKAVLRDGYDLVIKGVENPSWTARLFGSDDLHLLRKCPCPLWMLKPGDSSNYETILAAVDFDPWTKDSIGQPLNIEILEVASSIAVADFAALHLVHAWQAPGEMSLLTWANKADASLPAYIESERSRHRQGMEALCDKLRSLLGDEAYDYLSPRVHLPQQSPEAAIPQVARDISADLVVMGTLGRTGVPGLIIGNTAEDILDQLQCSVLALKPPGFKTPVTLQEDAQ